jgi:hypothetical protein
MTLHNQIISLDAAMSSLFHIGRQKRGVREFWRWAIEESHYESECAGK